MLFQKPVEDFIPKLRLIFIDTAKRFERARPGKARRLLIVPFKNKLFEYFMLFADNTALFIWCGSRYAKEYLKAAQHSDRFFCGGKYYLLYYRRRLFFYE